jgi:hypothetical protein
MTQPGVSTRHEVSRIREKVKNFGVADAKPALDFLIVKGKRRVAHS